MEKLEQKWNQMYYNINNDINENEDNNKLRRIRYKKRKKWRRKIRGSNKREK